MPDMAVEFMLTILSLLAMLALAAVPWAYKIHGRLTKIEERLQSYHISGERFANTERQITEHGFRIERLETITSK